METQCMHAADLVVTLGEVMREEIISRGVPAEKVLVAPNAVAAEFLQPLPDGGALRSALGIGRGEFVIGMVSSLFAYEGADTLLRAAAELRRRGVPARPLIVGDGPERPALQRLAADLRLGDVAIFTGRVPMAEVRHFHAVLDIFAVPRTGDRVCHLVTPLKPVEAMASGLCVVASEVKALREIIEPGITGTLTVPEDQATLADCAEVLFYSPDRRREIGARAREWAARDRTWAAVADRYLSAYTSVGAL
jgi:glycosyltransferase involved in cell wall biosynthesis